MPPNPWFSFWGAGVALETPSPYRLAACPLRSLALFGSRRARSTTDFSISEAEEWPRLTIGICAMSKKTASKPMRHIIDRWALPASCGLGCETGGPGVLLFEEGRRLTIAPQSRSQPHGGSFPFFFFFFEPCSIADVFVPPTLYHHQTKEKTNAARPPLPCNNDKEV